MSNIQAKERIHYFDIAKGLLILLLLIHHFPSATRDSGIINPFFPGVTAWTFIFYAFFMQCFIMVSGYCTNFDEDLPLFLKKIVKQLIIPWFIFEVIEITFWSFYYSDFSLQRYISFFITPPNTTLWFLNALAVSKIVVYAFKKWLDIKWILVITFVLLFGAIVINELNIGYDYFAIRESIGSCFFVAFGYYLKKNQTVYERLMKYSPYVYISTLVLLKLLKLGIPAFAAGISVPVKTFPVFFVLAITGSLSFLRLCKFINKNSILEYFGKNSLIVYGLHFCPLYAFVVLFYGIMPPTSVFELLVYLLMVYASELVVCVLLVQLFQLRCFKWIIGK